MRRSWSCLSLYAARDKKKKPRTRNNYMLLNLKSILSLPGTRSAPSSRLLSSLAKERSRISANPLPLTHGRPRRPLCHREDNAGPFFFFFLQACPVTRWRDWKQVWQGLGGGRAGHSGRNRQRAWPQPQLAVNGGRGQSTLHTCYLSNKADKYDEI